MDVRPKKSLGQHFLNDKKLAVRIVDLLQALGDGAVVEIGPGTGVLSRHLLERYGDRFHAVELDHESVAYLTENLPDLSSRIFEQDFLGMDLSKIFGGDVFIIGNFPYNISTQILFRVLNYRDQVREVVGMFQREVARRVSSGPGSKEYGILSVLLGAFYNITYEITVSEKVFTPPPKVKSGVIRLERNDVAKLGCNEELFFRVVKMGFNQRRKTLRNSLATIITPDIRPSKIFDNRPEQLSVESFLELTELIQSQSSETLR